jgi:hypothetical protein
MSKKVSIPLFILWLLTATLIVVDINGFWTKLEVAATEVGNGSNAVGNNLNNSTPTAGDGQNETSPTDASATDASGSNNDNPTPTTTTSSSPNINISAITVIEAIRKYQWFEFILTGLVTVITIILVIFFRKRQLKNATTLFTDKRAALYQVYPPSNIGGDWSEAISFWEALHSYLEVPKLQRLIGAGRHIAFEIVSRFHVNPNGISDTETGFYLGIPFFELKQKKTFNLQRIVQNQLTTIHRFIKIKRRKIGVEGSDPLAVLLNPELPDTTSVFNPNFFQTQKKKEAEGGTGNKNDAANDNEIVKLPAQVAYIELEVAHRDKKSVGGLKAEFDKDPLLNLLSQLVTDAQLPLAGVQIIIQAAEGTEINKAVARTNKLHLIEAGPSGSNGSGAARRSISRRSNQRKLAAKAERKELEDRKIDGGGFAITLRLFVCGTEERVTEWRNLAQNYYSHFRNTNPGGAFITLRAGAGAIGNDPQVLLQRRPVISVKERSFVTKREMALLAHFPNAKLRVAGIRWAGAMNLPPSPASIAGNKGDEWRVVFGHYEDANGVKKPIGQYFRDANKHIWLKGPSGVGKSECIRNLLLQFIAKQLTVVSFEPHNDINPKIMTTIPFSKEKDVVLVRLTNPDRSPALNPLELPADPAKREVAIPLVVSNMMGDRGVFATIMGASWDTAVQMQSILNAGIQLVLDCHKLPTLWTLYLALNRADFRNKLLATGKLREPIARNYWQHEFEEMGETEQIKVMGPPNRRISAFMRNLLARHLICQPYSTIRIRKLIDDPSGKIILFDIDKTKLGAELTKFLGITTFNKYKQEVYSRSEIEPEDLRNPGITSIDEFPYFLSRDYEVCLAEIRKFRQGLLMANQGNKQLQPATMLDAVSENTGTKIIFRQGKDAEYFAPLIKPADIDEDSMERSIRDQEAYHAYVRMLVNNSPQSTCLIETLPPQPKPELEEAELRQPSYNIPSKIFEGNEKGWGKAGLVEAITRVLEEQGWDYVSECMYYLDCWNWFKTLEAEAKSEGNKLNLDEISSDSGIDKDVLEAGQRINEALEEGGYIRTIVGSNNSSDVYSYLSEYFSPSNDDKVQNGLEQYGRELLAWVENDITGFYDRTEALQELSEADYALYRLTRMLRDMALRELILREPAHVPYKLTRCHLLSGLLYEIPRWEIEAEFLKVEDGDTDGDVFTKQELRQMREQVTLEEALVVNIEDDTESSDDEDPPLGDNPAVKEFTFGENRDANPNSENKAGKSADGDFGSRPASKPRSKNKPKAKKPVAANGNKKTR